MLDGFTAAPGGIDGNGIQVGKQLAEITAIAAYSFTVSCALLYIIKFIPGMHLRISDEAEEHGLDLDQFFEEQIGDWSLFEEMERKRHMPSIHAPGTPTIQEVASGSENDEIEKAKAV